MLGYHAVIVTRYDSRVDFNAYPCCGYSTAREPFDVSPCSGYSAAAGEPFQIKLQSALGNAITCCGNNSSPFPTEHRPAVVYTGAIHAVDKPFTTDGFGPNPCEIENMSIGWHNVTTLEKYDIPRDKIGRMIVFPYPIPQDHGP